MEFVAGVDGGGTKTECMLMDLDGNPISTSLFGSLNMNSRPQEEVAQSIRGVVGSVLAQDGECRMLCVGCAGLSNPEVRCALERMIRAEGYGGAYMLAGDQTAALYAAHGVGPGAVLISGTGSICFGRNASGATARAGGRGYKIDDEGSGYAIGRDILSAVVRAQDGRARPTVLTELVLAQLGSHSLNELIRALYTPGDKRGNVAAYAQLLPEAVGCGDAAACAILEKAVGELCLLAATVVKRLELTKNRLALSGGVLKNIFCVADGVAARLKAQYPELNIFILETSAAEGAARMALEAVRGENA